MVISDVTKYKSKIMNALTLIPDLITLIDKPNITIDNSDELENVNVFSYMKIPNTTMEDLNYVCFDYNAKSLSRNDLYKNVIINIATVCPESNMKTDYGNRYDAMAGVILESLNWSNILGFDLELVSDTEAIWENGYHARTLQFKNIVANSMKNGVRIN